jgi:toxin ParE1/3/4
MEVRRSEQAYSDLEAIYSYIVETSGLELTADAFASRIDARCDRIGEYPFSGRDRSDIRPGLRSIPFESVIILYLVRDDYVLITNIFHASQDYEALLRDS